MINLNDIKVMYSIFKKIDLDKLSEEEIKFTKKIDLLNEQVKYNEEMQEKIANIQNQINELYK